MKISKQLKMARIDAELDQAGLAERAGINKTSVSQIEAGKTDPRASTVKKWAEACGYDVRLVKRA